MDTIDLRRDPCADAIAMAMAAPADEAADVVEQGSTEPITTYIPGRERPVKYVQHPSYVRFLRPDTLAA